MRDLLRRWGSLPIVCPARPNGALKRREPAVRQGSACRARELAEPVRHGLLVSARLSPERRSRLAGADRVGGVARADAGAFAGGPDRRRGVAAAPSLSFGDQGHRAKTYKSGRDMSSAQCPRSDFALFRTGQSPCRRGETRKRALHSQKWASGASPRERDRSVSVLEALPG